MEAEAGLNLGEETVTERGASADCAFTGPAGCSLEKVTEEQERGKGGQLRGFYRNSGKRRVVAMEGGRDGSPHWGCALKVELTAFAGGLDGEGGEREREREEGGREGGGGERGHGQISL